MPLDFGERGCASPRVRASGPNLLSPHGGGLGRRCQGKGAKELCPPPPPSPPGGREKTPTLPPKGGGKRPQARPPKGGGKRLPTLPPQGGREKAASPKIFHPLPLVGEGKASWHISLPTRPNREGHPARTVPVDTIPSLATIAPRSVRASCSRSVSVRTSDAATALIRIRANLPERCYGAGAGHPGIARPSCRRLCCGLPTRRRTHGHGQFRSYHQSLGRRIWPRGADLHRPSG